MWDSVKMLGGRLARYLYRRFSLPWNTEIHVNIHNSKTDDSNKNVIIILWVCRILCILLFWKCFPKNYNLCTYIYLRWSYFCVFNLGIPKSYKHNLQILMFLINILLLYIHRENLIQFNLHILLWFTYWFFIEHLLFVVKCITN